MSPPDFRWLHVNAPMCPPESSADWAGVTREGIEELARRVPGPDSAPGFDVIVVTGDLTMDGSAAAYATATDLLDAMVARLGRPGCVVLACPGPADGDGFAAWWAGRLDAMPEHAEVREGAMPGDYSVTVTRNLFRAGFASINTAAGIRGAEAFGGMCGDSVGAWTMRHHVSALLCWQARRDDGTGRSFGEPDGGVPTDRFHVVHAASGVPMFQADNAVIPCRFTGYHRAKARFRELSRSAVLASVWPVAPAAAAVVTVSEVNLNSGEPGDVIFREAIRGFPLPDPAPGLSAPRRPARRRGASRPLDDAAVVEILWEVLRDATNFRGFVFSELREFQDVIPTDADPDRQVRRLVGAAGRDKVLGALKSYLPDTTARVLGKMGHGPAQSEGRSAPEVKVALLPEERSVLAELHRIAELAAHGPCAASGVFAHLHHALGELADGDVGAAAETMRQCAVAMASVTRGGARRGA